MKTAKAASITVESLVKAPVDKVWNYWNQPEHITRWNHPSDDWHSPRAENDLRPGGKFLIRMEARDGSMGFDFAGIYDEIKTNELVTYTLDYGRKVRVSFSPQGEHTRITETFDPETINPLEMQKQGWQAILDNFASYAEAGQ